MWALNLLKKKYNAGNSQKSPHAGLGWGGINFLHSIWSGAVFWICADNSGMFLFLLVRAYTESRPFLRLPHLVGVHKEMGGAQPGQLIPTDPGDIPDLWCHGQHTELGEKVGKGFLLRIQMHWHLTVVCPAVTCVSCNMCPCLSFQLWCASFRKKPHL